MITRAEFLVGSTAFALGTTLGLLKEAGRLPYLYLRCQQIASSASFPKIGYASLELNEKTWTMYNLQITKKGFEALAKQGSQLAKECTCLISKFVPNDLNRLKEIANDPEKEAAYFYHAYRSLGVDLLHPLVYLTMAAWSIVIGAGVGFGIERCYRHFNRRVEPIGGS